MSSWFSRSSGPFNVTLSNVYITGLAKLEVERGGQLQAQNIDMDIIFQDIALNFQNLGFLGSIFQVCTTARSQRNADFRIFILFSHAFEVSVLLELDAALLGNWFPAF
jgi:Haemolymph juvenile hormone binding protein (JHBP).